MSTPAKSRLYRELTRIGKALAHPARLEILDLVAQRERSVESLAEEIGLSMANASRHLRVLRAAELIETRKDGLFVRARIADQNVGAMIEAVRRAGEARLAEIPRTVETELRRGLHPIARDELVAVLAAGEATLVDVRPVEEYLAGHIPGALSIPASELPDRMEELPRDREIIACCRGPWCAWAGDAVRLLRARGYRARMFEQGPMQWELAGGRIEA